MICYWAGSQLAMMIVNPDLSTKKVLKFYYDAEGRPLCLDFNGTVYLYITNLQGDVVALADQYGEVIRYEYDAWGKPISTYYAATPYHDAMYYNPLRYRGYIYDNETGFYYLQSRYYDPVVGRFINSDHISYLGVSRTFVSFNLFVYCENNPVMGYDPTGTFNWEAFRQLGENCVKVGFAAICVAGAIAAIGTAVAGTAVSGGAGAVAIPAAMVLAVNSVAAAGALITSIGVVSVAIADTGEALASYTIGENGVHTPSHTVWEGKGGTERLDFENPVGRDGQIHYHDAKNNPHMYNFETRQFENPTPRINELMSDERFLKALKKAYRMLGESW